MKPSAGIVGMALFVLIWNGLVGTFEVAIGRAWLNQRDAAVRFVPVEAEVLESYVQKSRTDDGYTYRPYVRYGYQFDGERFESDRLTFMVVGTSDRSYADKAMVDYPTGVSVTALVDPDSPGSAVLDASNDSFPASVWLVLAPFQIIGLFLVSLLVKMLRGSEDEDEDDVRAKYVRVETPDHLVIGRPRMSLLGVFTVTLTVSIFLALFPFLFTYGMYAPTAHVFGAFVAATVFAAAITRWRHGVNKRPDNFVHIDRASRTFAFPADRPGTPIDSIQSILVDPRPTNMTVNGVALIDHHFEVETTDGLAQLFQVRTGQEEADGVLDLLRSELM